MAVTQDSYVGNGSRVSYPFTFPYLKASDVKASIDAVDTTAFTLTNATTLQFNTAPANGAKIKIFRETGIDSLSATFYAGSAIKSEDLNDNFTQNLFVTQEVNGRYISALGGTMTGNLNLGEDVDIVFEGATDNANETTITVSDPSQDNTITFPDTTGTVVTTGDTGTVATGMIAADAINGTKIADDSINSEHYVDGSIDTAHIADAQVTTAKLAADSVNGTKIADDSIDSEHYVDGSIDTAHIANLQVTTAKIADGNITHGKIQDNAVITAKIADGQVTSAKIASDAVTTAKVADDAITSAKLGANAVTTGELADTAVNTQKLDNFAVTSPKIAADAVTTAKIADQELKTLAGMQSGTASKLADSTALTADIADLNQIDGLTKQTTISDTDTSFPTSGAVVDYVTDRIDEIGGFEAITNETQFPNTQPVAGVAISIADAGGIVVNSSGTSTTGRTVGGSTVTINGIASNFNSSTVANGIRFIVTSTGSGQVYNYHKATLKEDDLVSLSGDINDFSERYRVGSSNPTSSLDSGDLFFNTGTGKLLVYNGTNSAWEEAQSVGNFFISTLSPAFDGTTQNFTLSNAPTNAQQILLSINGVVQKPNAGTSTPSEGFALDGSTIKLSAAPATGADYFAVVMGSTVNIGTPSDNTVDTDILQNQSVTSAKIADGTIVNADVNASAAIAGTKISPDFGSQNITTTGTVNSGNVHISSQVPQISLLDAGHNPDYIITNTNGAFKVTDYTYSVDRFVINTDGHVDFTNNVDFGAGIDVTGNITVSGTVDGVDIAALNTTVGNITTDVVSDTSPQLGGLLDGNGNTANFTANNTGLGLPSGTVAQEPTASNYEGYIRYNTDDNLVYYSDGTSWLKIAPTKAVLNSVTGTLFDGITSTLTLAGTGFLSANLVVNFLQSSDSINANVTVTPSSDTAATVAVPSSVFSNVTAGNVVTIKVTNSDGQSSGNVTITATSLPTGGTITTYTDSGNTYRVHTFTTSGNFVNTISGLTATYLIVAGGGGAACDADVGGGGGAGGLLTGTTSPSVNTHQVVVGNGGLGANTHNGGQYNHWRRGEQGGNSSFAGNTAIGGGYGQTRVNALAGGNGGSGGGGGDNGNQPGGSGTSGQGHNGGGNEPMNSNNGNDQGGGGGAGSAGSGRHPGSGYTSTITGTSKVYARGGSGYHHPSSLIVHNTDNYGWGGRGSTGIGTADAYGAKGVVIIRYQI